MQKEGHLVGILSTNENIELFIIKLSAFFKITLTQWMNCGPKPKDQRVARIKKCSTESKAFSKSALKSIPSLLFSSVYSNISLIEQMDCPTYLPLIYAVWSCLIMFGDTFFILPTSTLDANLVSTFIKVIGLQFLIYLSSFSQLM